MDGLTVDEIWGKYRDLLSEAIGRGCYLNKHRPY